MPSQDLVVERCASPREISLDPGFTEKNNCSCQGGIISWNTKIVAARKAFSREEETLLSRTFFLSKEPEGDGDVLTPWTRHGVSELVELRNVTCQNICHSNSEIAMKVWRHFVCGIRGWRIINHPPVCPSYIGAVDIYTTKCKELH